MDEVIKKEIEIACRTGFVSGFTDVPSICPYTNEIAKRCFDVTREMGEIMKKNIQLIAKWERR